jgi:SAM-dependent methyltransferase
MPTLEEGWWEEERAVFVRERMRVATTRGALVADIGCGRGRLLGEAGLDATVVNVDSHLWENWRVNPEVAFVCASASALPFRDAAFDVVGSFDVLEHLHDDLDALREQRRVLCGEGTIVTAVPADHRLWSAHDDAVGHVRRYDTDMMAALARSAGLEIRYATHFFSFLWLPARLTRRFAMRTAEPGNGGGTSAALIRHAVALLAAAERRILRRWRLPLGTSMWFESVPSKRAT